MQAQFLEHKGIELIMSADVDTAYLRKVQFDALRWQMARLNPVVYGERANETHIATVTNNYLVLDTARLKELQDWRKEALQ